MASVRDGKSNAYRQKQSIRDECGAPQFLESAGDVLIKNLVRKQLETSTSIEEQFKIIQNFEKGFELIAELRSGVIPLKDFKQDLSTEVPSSCNSITSLNSQMIEDLMLKSGLSRYELELNLSEKPNSEISKLYKFAIGNKKQKDDQDSAAEEKLPNHPIHRLKEIEEECFGHLKAKSHDATPISSSDKQGTVAKKVKNDGKKRKRKRKKNGLKINKIINCTFKKEKNLPNQDYIINKDCEKPLSFRPSLWDVKDMKKWSTSKIQGCNPQTFYTIKDGKIIKLEEKQKSEMLT